MMDISRQRDNSIAGDEIVIAPECRDRNIVPQGVVRVVPKSIRNRKNKVVVQADVPEYAGANMMVLCDTNDNGEVFDVKTTEEALARALAHWCPLPENDNSGGGGELVVRGAESHYTNMIALACKRFHIDWDGVTMPPPPSFNRQHITNQYQFEIQALQQLEARACQIGVFEDAYRRDFCRLQSAVFYARQTMMNLCYFYETWKLHYTASNDPTIMHFYPLDRNDPDISEYQKLVIFFLEKVFEFRYVRYKNKDLYRRIYNQDGVFTHTYEFAISIADFVYSMISTSDRFQLWKMFCKEGSLAKSLIEFLSKCRESSLPVLDRDRYVHAFKNGLYFVQEDHFEPYVGDIESSIVACKYHPCVFEASKYAAYTEVDFDGDVGADRPRLPNTAYDIPTPTFDTIMTSQNMSYQVRVWMYVFLGRMLWWANDGDTWQVWAFHYGLANTGKSTLCKVVRELMFDPQDVGNLSNSMERSFGVSALIDKFAVVASEVGQDFSIDRTELQQMITAESISVRTKNVTASDFDFNLSGMMAGNHIPLWDDPQGAMARRVIIFLYYMKVMVDNELFGKMRLEMPNFILKANRMYLAARAYVGKREIWSVLPQYFYDNRTMFQSQTSPIHGFLRSEEISLIGINRATKQVDESIYVPMTTLRDRYRQWRIDNQIKGGVQWNAESYAKAFSDYGLAQPTRHRLPYPRDSTEPIQQTYVFGIDTAAEVQRLQSASEPPVINLRGI
jgi:hypothetical protein